MVTRGENQKLGGEVPAPCKVKKELTGTGQSALRKKPKKKGWTGWVELTPVVRVEIFRKKKDFLKGTMLLCEKMIKGTDLVNRQEKGARGQKKNKEFSLSQRGRKKHGDRDLRRAKSSVEGVKKNNLKPATSV